MKKVGSLLFLLSVCLFAKAQTSSALKVTQTKLSNGLTVWLNEDHSQPKVFGAIVVKAGSKDCPDTGIAHYFEHIMFKGTDKIGTVNYQAEKIWLDSIAAKYELLSQTKDETGRRAIQKEINRLSQRAADYAIPNEFPRLISKYGGSGLNAGTSYDYTAFYNTFSSPYIAQWAELNSERLIHPVFRLFQGELETVYEEKNMYADNFIWPSFQNVVKAYFGNHPYAYPIIGSTENLKNPRLSEMEAFFKKYYVATNMGLILCGDFDTDSILPLLENTFGRIVKGVVPNRQVSSLPPLKGAETVKIKVPIPLIKGEIVAFRAPVDSDADAPALNLAIALLTNSNETGFLDSLTNEHKVLGAVAMRAALNDAGIAGFGFVPNIPFGSLSKVESFCWGAINRLKTGDFSQETLDALKLEASRKAQTNLENIDKRAEEMISVFSQGRTWDEYLAQASSIANLTKTDIVRVSNKYFTDNYIKFKKKFGSYPKDKIAKPDYTPIKSKNISSSSQYAKQLDTLPIKQISPRLIDFNKDVETINVTPHVTLYAAKNHINNVFSLSLTYHKGNLSEPRLSTVAEYLTAIGTDSLTKQHFGEALQKLGTTFGASASMDGFTLHLSGFDRNLEPSLKLLSCLMLNPKADKKAMKTIAAAYKVSDKVFSKSSDNIADAMFQKVAYGNQSEYLSHSSLREIKKMKGADLLDLFKSLSRLECSIVYSGQLSAPVVAEAIRHNLPVDKATIAVKEERRIPQNVSEPVIYFYNLPSARQSIIQTYQSVRPCLSAQDKAKFMLWGSYFGQGFSSLLFQEIREFRAYAYYAYGTCLMPSVKYAGDPTAYITRLSTQYDKTMLALGVLDSLFNRMPVREKNIETIKQEIINQINNDYPSFREIADKVALYKMKGYSEDPHTYLIKELPHSTMNDISSFYQDAIVHNPRIIMVVGNEKKLPMKELAKYGRIVRIKKADIYR